MINVELFRRTAPAKKLEYIKKLKTSDILKLSEDSIKKMLRAVGEGKKGSPNKRLWVSCHDQNGNNWNSRGIVCWEIYKKRLLIDVDLAYSNTDTEVGISYSDFLKCKEIHYTYEDHNGYPQTATAHYNDDQIAECVRAFIITYLHIKYKEKLKTEE